MGTRHLIAVQIDGQYKVAQYGQFDGYLTGQGTDVLNFLRDKMDIDLFKEKLRQCSWITDEEYSDAWVDCGAEPNSDFVNVEVSQRFYEKYPWLHRSSSAEVLSLIQDSENGLKLANSINFAGGSLFCEWAYVIDFDKNTFEIYKGFNKNPLSESDRFYFLKVDDDALDYNQVKLVREYSFDELPTPDDLVELDKEIQND